MFADDFTGAAGTGVNTANWLYDLGTGYPGGAANWGTGEIETMTNSTANVYQDGAGHLVIKPIRTPPAVDSGRMRPSAPTSPLRPAASCGSRRPSSSPTSAAPAAAGYWPAFWTLGAAARRVGATDWPGIGEIDIMEDINGRSSEFATLHCGTSPGGVCNETTGLGSW